MKPKRIPIEPVGKILLEEFLKPLNLTQYRVAKDCKIPHSTMTQIISGKRPISTENAVRIGRYFGTSAQFWLNLQNDYELRLLKRDKLRLIEKQIQPFKRAA